MKPRYPVYVVSKLRDDCLDVQSVQMDWSEGYPETWDFVEAPCCNACGAYARWDDEENAWICRTSGCENEGEIEASYENGAEGPMMNYYYPLPSDFPGWYEAADAIRDLPLCIVRAEGRAHDDPPTLPGSVAEYALALTGGGMDLSWEICEAFIRLGYLPPARFADDLPGMAGYPQNDDQRVVVRACVRSLALYAKALERRAIGASASADRLAERYADVLQEAADAA